MHGNLVTSNFDEIMNELASRHHSVIRHFRHSRATNSAVSGRIWPKFELIQDNMHIFATCMFKKDQIDSNIEKSGDIDFKMLKRSSLML